MQKRLMLVLVLFIGANLACKQSFSKDQETGSDVPFIVGVTETVLPTLAPPTPTPTTTSLPTVRVYQGDWALFLGDFDQAKAEFQMAYQAGADPELQAAALVGMARADLYSGNYDAAVTILNSVIEQYPETTQLANAYFHLGEGKSMLQDPGQAVIAYQAFTILRPGILDSIVEERRGDLLMESGDPAGAILAYQAAIQADQLAAPDNVAVKIGRAYAALEDHASAVRQFLEIYDSTTNDYIKAQVNYLAGQSYVTMGVPDQAHARYQDSIQNYPLSYDAYLGLVELIEAGIPVSDLDRGIVDYYARQYGVALDALSRYINNNPGLDGTALHFKALSLRAMDRSDEAITVWEELIRNYAGDDYWISAWEQIAVTQWSYVGDYEKAAGTYLSFVNLYPAAPQSPGFLFSAARIQEMDNQLEDAAHNWERLINEYPTAEESSRGLFLAGITYFRLSNYVRAQTTFQRILVLATSSNEQAAAYFWIGKALRAQGDEEDANASWELAALADPTGYYSERAKEILDGYSPLSSVSTYDLGFDLENERTDAEIWVRSTFAIPLEIDLSGLGSMAEDPRVRRGDAMWELGLYSEALMEYEDLREGLNQDSINNFRLMDHLLHLGFYRPAIFTSRNILDMANLDDAATLGAPIYFNHIRFGPYYQELVLPLAQEYDLHPMLLFSVMRQESLFEGFVQSSAGARGVMQIMPATAQEVVSIAGWPPGYQEKDLYRPVINIPLGVRYLARQRDYFDGNLYNSLAAYNAGPGNAMHWKSISPDDPDLFLEVIRFDETRHYIMNIADFFHIYQKIYERIPS
jgi:soluble lytic murein transglycosylase